MEVEYIRCGNAAIPPYVPQATPLKVCVTGAAGQIAYSLLYQIGHGDVFGKEQVGLPTVQLYTAGACYIKFIWVEIFFNLFDPSVVAFLKVVIFCVTKAHLSSSLILFTSLPSSVPSHC